MDNGKSLTQHMSRVSSSSSLVTSVCLVVLDRSGESPDWRSVMARGELFLCLKVKDGSFLVDEVVCSVDSPTDQIDSVLKAVVAQFNADQLLTESPHQHLDLNIEPDDVAITQYVIRYGVLEGSGGEANGSARSEEVQVCAGMGLIELRRIEASWDVAAALARSPNVAYLLARWEKHVP
ncbi:hypothetical protein HID58_049210 [Brassica napus]|uniref:Uncharacterized protein n=1 Tax=Brassica napus TaxID=3708 RepID=A0ABQ8B4B9_BRANA|nr:hypothetical protein HID58_049210 [Brassica napus]